MRRAEGLEKSLRKKKFIESYNDVFQEYVDRGVHLEVLAEEIEEWNSQQTLEQYATENGGQQCSEEL